MTFFKLVKPSSYEYPCFQLHRRTPRSWSCSYFPENLSLLPPSVLLVPLSTNLVVHQDRLVHDLLELGVLQIASHHHLQHLEEFPVGDEAVIVQVINPDIIQVLFKIYFLFAVLDPCDNLPWISDGIECNHFYWQEVYRLNKRNWKY